jgi:hypothetical protein
MVWVGYRRSPDDARRIADDPDALDALLESADDTSVDLDKMWHGLHWLLTGSAEPTADVTSDAVFGGEPMGEDHGYGPARFLAAPTVRAVATALAAIDPGDLGARVDPAAMMDADLYPVIWDEDGIFDDSLLPAFDDLRAFYLAAAEAGEVVIQVIC